MYCKVIKIVKSVVVVRYRDVSGNFQATIIPGEEVPRVRVGDDIEVPDHVIATGTEYGIDWTILMDSIVITPEEIQAALRAHGIWTDTDFKTMPRERTAALLSLTSNLAAVMLQRLREEL